MCFDDPLPPKAPSTPWICALVAGVLGAILAWRNPDFFNHDGVAYCRIAEYWAEGAYRLALNGYWSPVLSWFSAALIHLGFPTLPAIRIAIILGGLVFVGATHSLLHSLAMPPSPRRWILWATALNVSFWSVRQITPDLPAAGFFLYFWAYALRIPKSNSTGSALAAGTFLAVAALTKAVYLPVGFVCLFLLAVSHVGRTPRASRRRLWKPMMLQWGLSVAPVLVAVGAWSLALTHRYGAWTWSTSAQVNHAATHPPLRVWPNPCMTRLHIPDNGRVTSWEDPSEQPWPPPWKPWTSATNASHQSRLVAQNLPLIAWNFARIDLLGVGIVSVVASLFWGRFVRRENVPAGQSTESQFAPWNLPLEIIIPIAALTLVYCPFPFVESNPRFFYAALPLLHVSAVRCSEHLSRLKRRVVGIAVRWDRLVHASFILPSLFWILAGLYGISRFAPAGSIALQLARHLKAEGPSGPVAGSAAFPGGRVGLYLAWTLQQPWYGDDEDASPEDFHNIGARIIVLRRDDPRAKAFETHSEYRELAIPDLAPPSTSRPVRMFVASRAQ